jgi:DNA ligase-1
VETSRQVAATRSRLEKVAHLAAFIRELPPGSVALGVSYLSGELPQGRLGIGASMFRDLGARTPGSALAAAPERAPLELVEVDATMANLKLESGAGSASRRAALLAALFDRATAEEREFLVRLVFGELRQGALEGILMDAVGRAFGIAGDHIRRATMLAGALPPVADALAREGPSGLSRFELTMFRPVQPMLADTAVDLADALERQGESGFEYKLDGARVQVHKDGERVEIYTRQLNRVTTAVPEIVELVSALPARRLLLDGEAIALSPAQRPLPFQTTMRRFGRRLDVERLRHELPIDVRFFDVLRIDDHILLDLPLAERWQALDAVTGGAAVVPRLVTTRGDEAAAFLAGALAAGHEGLMAKTLASVYTAGRRGQEWLKLKAAHTLDLVVLAAEWGSGRRQGWLSNLHLGAREVGDGGTFVMLGKTFKGMTDAILQWQTGALLAREIARDAFVVHVRPELVVEVEFNDVQISPQYPGGVALRFARLKRYRPDKSAAQASTIADVRALLPAA